jgi:hypothetical protein
MDNSKDFEIKNYEKARHVEYSVFDNLRFLFNLLWIVIRMTAVLIFEVFLQLKELVLPKKPKDISGQIALVTGLCLSAEVKCFSEFCV